MEARTKSLLRFCSQQPSCSLDEAVLRTEELTGIRRSASRMRAFLLRHGFHYLKTGHAPAKADTDRQKQWVETKLVPAIQVAKEGQIHLLFLDAAESNGTKTACVFLPVESSTNIPRIFGSSMDM